MLGERLRTIREKLGMTQEMASQRACSRSMISRIESGDLIPTLKLLEKICENLGVNVAELLNAEWCSGINNNEIAHARDLISLRSYNAALNFTEELLHCKRTSKDKRVLAEMHLIQGEAYNRLGRYAEAFDAFDRASSLAPRQLSTLVFDATNGKAATLLNLNQHTNAMRLLETLHNYKETGFLHDRTLIRVMYNLSKARFHTGDLSRSLVHIQEGLFKARSTGILEVVGHLETMKGLTLLRLHNSERAVESFFRALHFYRFDGDEIGIRGSLANLSELHLSPAVNVDTMMAPHTKGL